MIKLLDWLLVTFISALFWLILITAFYAVRVKLKIARHQNRSTDGNTEQQGGSQDIGGNRMMP